MCKYENISTLTTTFTIIHTVMSLNSMLISLRIYGFWPLLFFCSLPPIFLRFLILLSIFWSLQPFYCNFVIFVLFSFYSLYPSLLQLKIDSTVLNQYPGDCHHLLIFFLFRWILYLSYRWFFSACTYNAGISQSFSEELFFSYFTGPSCRFHLLLWLTKKIESLVIISKSFLHPMPLY